MIVAEKLTWKFISLIIVTVGGLAVAQTPDSTADSLKQLRDVTVKRTLAGAGDYVRYCAFCHGNEGKGDGLNAFNLKIRPRDFTDTVAMRGKTLASLTKVIRAGGAASGLSKDMPPWGSTLDSVQIGTLAQFLMYYSKKASIHSEK